jgi:hypothetical protein
MPKRSNEFQRLVFLVKQQVAEGCTVTESQMLRDRHSDTPREVDVCIQKSVADHVITVCVECRDHTRKANVKWVEEMKAKHERLATNCLVLVSRSGFTAEAKKIAALYNIETLTYEEVNSQSVSQLFGELSSVWAKVVCLKPTKVVFKVRETDELPAESVSVLPDTAVYSSNGNPCGTAMLLVQFFLNGEGVTKEILSRGERDHKWFVTGWPNPLGGNREPLYLQKLEPLVMRQIELIEITGTCDFDINEFPLSRGRLGTTDVAWGSGTFLNNDALLVASQDEAGEKRVSISPKDAANFESWESLPGLFQRV